MNEDLEIRVMRIGEIPNKGHIFGVMTIMNGETEIGRFSTLERGGNTVSLKTGKYDMHHSIKRTHRKVQCLRPKIYYISTILIHDAYKDNANELEGCIAPFMHGGEADSYSGSKEAMVKLWELLGGFDETHKKIVKLNILNNVPGDNREKAKWLAYRKATWDTKYRLNK